MLGNGLKSTSDSVFSVEKGALLSLQSLVNGNPEPYSGLWLLWCSGYHMVFGYLVFSRASEVF